MTITRITLRFIFGTVIILFLFCVLFRVFNSNQNQYFTGYILFLTGLYFYLPAVLLLIILSIYSYLSRRIFWSLFKIEYYFLFATLILFVSESIIESICANCNLLQIITMR